MQSTPKSVFLTIGTRGSPLALVQAHQVRRELAQIHQVAEDDIVVKIISTAGDRSQISNVSLSEIGGKGLFSKEIEDQLLAGEIDLAVHSTKDMATTLPDGLVLDVFLPREDIRDAFLSVTAKTLDELPQNAIIGTSSLRRRAQLRRYRPDLQMVEFRGNLGTRIEKLEKGIADATLLAAAGLSRLGQTDRIASFLDPRQFPPAPAQGAIGLERRANDSRVEAIAEVLNHAQTRAEIIAERAMLKVIDGSCRTPIGAFSRQADGMLSINGQLLSPDGSQIFDAEISGAASDALKLGSAIGEALLGKAGPDFIAALDALK